MSTEESPGIDRGPINGRPPLALIAGPTASGKSDCAVALALQVERAGVPTIIINADSAQVYKDLTVLSARPTPEEMQGITHRLFGAWNGATPCSAADWASAAKTEIAEAHRKGVLPILVGGTGLYMRTLLDGIAPIPEIVPEVRAQVRAMPVGDAYAALSREDPERAAKLAPADSTRIARALEVVRSTGRPLGAWQEIKTGGIGDHVNLSATILLPNRDALYNRCDLRFDRMLDRGAIEEVEALLARNLDPALPVMKAIGVPEIAAYLENESTLDEAKQRGAQATRNYAKRQFTWFRHQPPEAWRRLEFEDFDPEVLGETLFHSLPLT